MVFNVQFFGNWFGFILAFFHVSSILFSCVLTFDASKSPTAFFVIMIICTNYLLFIWASGLSRQTWMCARYSFKTVIALPFGQPWQIHYSAHLKWYFISLNLFNVELTVVLVRTKDECILQYISRSIDHTKYGRYNFMDEFCN